MGNIAIIIVAVISLFGNIMQFALTKKYNDINSLNTEMDALKKIQEANRVAQETQNALRENELNGLRKKVEKQEEMLKENREEIERLQRIIAKLIGDGCHTIGCKDRQPYTLDEINQVTNNDNK